MSLKVSQLVWKAILPSTQTLVAVRLADFADDAGGRVFPSNRRVAKECGLSERAVRETIRALEQAGILILVALENPGQRLPREYRFDLAVLTALADSPASETAEGAVEAAAGSLDEGADTGASGSGGNHVPPLNRGAAGSGGNHVPPREEPRAPDPLYNPPRTLVPPAAGESATARAAAPVVTAEPPAMPSPPTPPKPKSPHIVVGERIAALTGWDQSPNWFGNYSLVIPWLAKGWDPDLDIIPTVERLMNDRNRRHQGPPRSLEYFQDAIAEAFEIRNRQIPEGRANVQRTIQPSSSVKSSAHGSLFEAGARLDLILGQEEPGHFQ